MIRRVSAFEFSSIGGIYRRMCVQAGWERCSSVFSARAQYHILQVWALCVIGYLYAPLMGMSPLVFPLILMSVCVIWFFNPLTKPEGAFHRSSRYWLLRRCFFCFTAPLHMVTFADFWLGDQMNSLLTVFLDMQYFVCFYTTEVCYAEFWTVINGSPEAAGVKKIYRGTGNSLGCFVYLFGDARAISFFLHWPVT